MSSFLFDSCPNKEPDDFVNPRHEPSCLFEETAAVAKPTGVGGAVDVDDPALVVLRRGCLTASWFCEDEDDPYSALLWY
jgi:hypothetical protein